MSFLSRFQWTRWEIKVVQIVWVVLIQIIIALVRWSLEKGEHFPVEFVETMIDHLEIKSETVQVDSIEGHKQVGKYGIPAIENGNQILILG